MKSFVFRDRLRSLASIADDIGNELLHEANSPSWDEDYKTKDVDPKAFNRLESLLEVASIECDLVLSSLKGPCK